MLLELTKLPVQSPSINLEEYIGLVKAVALKFHKKFGKIEDSEAFSIAAEQLVIAYQGYDPSCGPFRQFAYRSMVNAVITHIRHQKRKKRTAIVTSIDDSIPEIAMAKQENILPVELLTKFLASYPSETEQDRSDKALLVEFYLDEIPISDIAKRENTSKVTIYNRLRRILCKIRNQYSEIIEEYGDMNVYAERKD